MSKMAFMTIEVTVTDWNRTIEIGGPPDQARNMRSRLAKNMNLSVPTDDRMLQIELDSDDIKTVLLPLLEEFPGIGWHFVDDLPQIYREARPSSGLHCVPDGSVHPFKVTDYDWLNSVIQEGFDLDGPHGPTYWRIAVTDKNRYYGTIALEGTYYLVVAELERGSLRHPILAILPVQKH